MKSIIQSAFVMKWPSCVHQTIFWSAMASHIMSSGMVPMNSSSNLKGINKGKHYWAEHSKTILQFHHCHNSEMDVPLALLLCSQLHTALAPFRVLVLC